MNASLLIPWRVRRWCRYATNPRWRRRQVAARRLRELTRNTVVGGPFEGMTYVPNAHGSAWCPKILGTYEQELRAIVEEIGELGFANIVNIGAAEGYYAVGLARRCPGTVVTCFELNTEAHATIRSLAEKNGVAERVTVLGACTHDRLQAAASRGRTCVICDIEGAEIDILAPGLCPALVDACLLVEVHDCKRPECGSTLRRRFGSTHDIVMIPAVVRQPADFPSGVRLPPRLFAASLDEGRPSGMFWFWMKPKKAE